MGSGVRAVERTDICRPELSTDPKRAPCFAIFRVIENAGRPPSYLMKKLVARNIAVLSRFILPFLDLECRD